MSSGLYPFKTPSKQYREVVGKSYRRAVPRSVELRSNALNNRAVSLLDLGRKKEAYDIWTMALKLDVYHPESVSDKALLEWTESIITDDEVVRLKVRRT